MREAVFLKNRPTFISVSTVGGYEESRCNFKEGFDLFDTSDKFNQTTWEKSEGEMQRLCLNFALKKADLTEGDLEAVFAGDLQNQCVASSFGLYPFGIPYVGLYGACSTLTEALICASMLFNLDKNKKCAAVVSSHNSSAERQFRTPLEYGSIKSPTSQWTSTAAGAFILGSGGDVEISAFMIGKIVDGITKDAMNMGGAMARAASDTILRFFDKREDKIEEYDRIVTGDLGDIGSDILCDLVSPYIPSFKDKHADCGSMLYDRSIQNINAGASGPATSAIVLANYFLPKLKKGEYKKILFLSTGALMSPNTIKQGQSILGIAPAVEIRSVEK